MLLHAVETTPSAVAVVDDGGEMSFAALRDRVERLATSVVRDTQPGDRVAILAMNRREYVEVQYAVPCSGRRASGNVVSLSAALPDTATLRAFAPSLRTG